MSVVRHNLKCPVMPLQPSLQQPLHADRGRPAATGSSLVEKKATGRCFSLSPLEIKLHFRTTVPNLYASSVGLQIMMSSTYCSKAEPFGKGKSARLSPKVL